MRRYRESTSVTVTFSGAPAEVETQVRAYLADYDPRGYGTVVQSDTMATATGIRTVVVWRSRSCD